MAARETISSTADESPRKTLSSIPSAGTRTWLDTLAQKLKATTELFHRQPTEESSVKSGESLARTVRGRSRSPKKSVRFRSQTYTEDSAASSSPINVPTKTAPSLPALVIPAHDMMKDFRGQSEQTPIPTGRPERTSYLKSLAAEDYFFPFPSEIDQKLTQLKAEQSPSPLPIDVPEQQLTQTLPENPFDDAAAIPEVPPSSLVSAEDVAEEPLAVQGANKATELLTPPPEYVAAAPSLEQTYLPRMAEVSEASNPFTSSSDATEKSHSAQTSTRPTSDEADLTKEPLIKHSSEDSLPHPSPWSLSSRPPHRYCVDLGTDSESDDSETSVRRCPPFPSKLTPTHEDIRGKFRMKGRDRASPVSIGAPTHTSEGEKQAPTPDPVKSSDNESADAWGPSPMSTSRPGGNLFTAASSTTSRRRESSVRRSAGRAFRFSNASPTMPSEEGVSPTAFGWEGHKLATADGTPSPVSVPLPLSIPNKSAPSRWRDQHGWTPFAEPQFHQAFAEAYQDNSYSVLKQTGGFAKFWRVMGLPEATNASDDTKALTESDLESLSERCFAILETSTTPRGRERSSAPAQTPPFASSVKKDVDFPGSWTGRIGCTSRRGIGTPTIDNHFSCALPMDSGTVRRKVRDDCRSASANTLTDGMESVSTLSVSTLD